MMPPLYTPTKAQIIKALWAVRERVCAYSDETFKNEKARCDCKYGASMRGEETGCPEIHFINGLLKHMTPTEYKRLVKRMEKANKPKKRVAWPWEK